MGEIKSKIQNGVNVEKITNIPFDEIIGHSECERKYFTIENNDIIYSRLIKETNIEHNLPYLGASVDFGLGDICLEEGENVFKFYIIDRRTKFQYQEFVEIEKAIDKLMTYYEDNDYIDSPETMRKIFFETLNLSLKKLTRK